MNTMLDDDLFEVYTIGDKTITKKSRECLHLSEVIQRKRVSPLFNSVYIHRDGTVAIEEYDGNFQASYGNSEQRFEEVRVKIHKELEKVFPLLLESGFFIDEAYENFKSQDFQVVFYSNPYYMHLYDCLYLDNDYNVIGHFPPEIDDVIK